MTNYGDTSGFLELTDGTDTLYCYFKEFQAKRVFEGSKINHYSGGNHYSYDLGTRYWVFKFYEIMITDHTKYDNVIQTLEDFHDAGTFTLKVKRASGSYHSFYGDTTITVRIPKNGYKTSGQQGADGNPFMIDELQLEQAG